MSCNNYQPHVHILPEDDANRQLANGFVLGLNPSDLRKIQVLPEAGGWREVLTHFSRDHVAGMDRYPHRCVVLLLDFDESETRLDEIKQIVPKHLQERVFVFGAWSEPERLKAAGLVSYEQIGSKIAEDCRTASDEIWSHKLLTHNKSELNRFRQRVCHIFLQK